MNGCKRKVFGLFALSEGKEAETKRLKVNYFLQSVVVQGF